MKGKEAVIVAPVGYCSITPFAQLFQKMPKGKGRNRGSINFASVILLSNIIRPKKDDFGPIFVPRKKM